MLHLLPVTPASAVPDPESPGPESQQRRQRLRTVGARLMVQRGLADAGLSAIGAAAGLKPSAAARTYRSRDYLLGDILYRHQVAILEALGEADDIHRNAHPERRLIAGIAAMLTTMRANHDAHRLLHGAAGTVPAPAAGALRHVRRLIAVRLTMMLEAAIPGLTLARELQAPLSRGLLAAISDAGLWLREDGPLSHRDYPRLLARQTIAGARAALAGYMAEVRAPAPALIPARRTASSSP